MIKKIKYIIPFALPLAAFAQDLNNLANLVQAIGNIVEIALPIVVGIALLAFFWGLAKYIFAAGDEEKKKEGKNIMIWGAIAIFVMVSIFGIVRFIGNAFNIETGGGTFDPPTVRNI